MPGVFGNQQERYIEVIHQMLTQSLTDQQSEKVCLTFLIKKNLKYLYIVQFNCIFCNILKNKHVLILYTHMLMFYFHLSESLLFPSSYFYLILIHLLSYPILSEMWVSPEFWIFSRHFRDFLNIHLTLGFQLIGLSF